MRTREVEELFVEPPPRVSLRRFMLALLAIGAVGGIVAIGVVARSRADAAAQVRITQAGVTVIQGTMAELKATEGQGIGVGDVVRTDATGRARIDLFDGSIVRLDGNTEVTLRTLDTTPDTGEIALGLLRGRTWNRVAERSSTKLYSVDVGEAVVTSVATTFMTDCTQAPTCYVLGVEGKAVVGSGAGDAEVGADDCVEISPDGSLSRCDPAELVDGWVRENLAEDEQLTFAPRPTPTPSPTLVPTRRPAPRPATPGVATPAPTDPPDPTAAQTEEPPETTGPKRTKKPTPEPTPTPVIPSDDPEVPPPPPDPS